MAQVSRCPRCDQPVAIPQGAVPEARVSCPMCGAEYRLQEAMAAATPAPELILLPSEEGAVVIAGQEIPPAMVNEALTTATAACGPAEGETSQEIEPAPSAMPEQPALAEAAMAQPEAAPAAAEAGAIEVTDLPASGDPATGEEVVVGAATGLGLLLVAEKPVGEAMPEQHAFLPPEEPLDEPAADDLAEGDAVGALAAPVMRERISSRLQQSQAGGAFGGLARFVGMAVFGLLGIAVAYYLMVRVILPLLPSEHPRQTQAAPAEPGPPRAKKPVEGSAFPDPSQMQPADKPEKPSENDGR